MPTPQDRGFFGSLNTIVNVVESTCEDKWDVLIDTALPAAGKALWLLIVPSPGEILENYLQPLPSRSGGKRGNRDHGRRINTRFGGRRWWQRLGFPDIDSIVAEKLPGRDLFKGRKAGPLERYLWQGIDILDRGLWYWLILDASETFVVEWASGIMESRFCTSSFDAALILENSGYPTAGNSPLWDQSHFPTVKQNKGWQLGLTGAAIRSVQNGAAKGTVNITLTADLNDSPNPEPRHYQLRINAEQPNGTDLDFDSPEVSARPGGSLEMAFSFDTPPIDFIRFDIQQRSGESAVGLSNTEWRISALLDRA